MTAEAVRQTPRVLRLVYVPFIGLAAAATIVLYMLPDQTGTYFAWTIQSPLTATMLGAGYAGALIFFLSSIREPVWANVRVAVAAPFALSVTLLLATLLHLDRFHLGAAPLPAFVAWLWLVVYIVVPPALAMIWVVQMRAPGHDPARTRPLPPALRLGAAVMATFLGTLGVALFIFPPLLAEGWPWALTPLTSRAVAGWLIGLAVAFGLAAVENERTRLKGAGSALFVVGLFGLGAVLRYSGEVRWQGFGAYLLLICLAAFMLVGAAGYLLAASPSKDRTA